MLVIAWLAERSVGWYPLPHILPPFRYHSETFASRAQREDGSSIAGTTAAVAASPVEPTSLKVQMPTASAEAASAYAEHFTALLGLELDKAMEDAQSRLKLWTRQQLGREGYAVFGLECSANGALGGSKLVLVSPLPTGFSDVYPGGLFRRFAVGDVVSLRAERQPSKSNPTGALASGLGRREDEAVVVDKGASWLQLSTGARLPAAFDAEVASLNCVGEGEGDALRGWARSPRLSFLNPTTTSCLWLVSFNFSFFCYPVLAGDLVKGRRGWRS